MSCWINTNERYLPGAYLDMIRHAKASLYDGDNNPRYRINPAVNGRYVFLYHDGIGIIAVGTGGEIFQGHYIGEPTLYEECIMLEDFRHSVDLASGKFINSISPEEIIAQGHGFFARAVVPINNDIAIELHKECVRKGFL